MDLEERACTDGVSRTPLERRGRMIPYPRQP